jgi:hypothetical protein
MSGLLQVRVRALPDDKVVGIYNGQSLPTRMRFLHPQASSAFLQINGVTLSDMFRSAEASLRAVKAKRGAKPPGFSGHNFGLSIDLDVRKTMKIFHMTKRDLDKWMEAHGWYCHRLDHMLKFESWHYNFLGPGTIISPKVRTTMGYIEARIQQYYGPQLVANMTDDRLAQRQLQRLHLYSGDLDGSFGPLSREAMRAFQRTWNLPQTGRISAKAGRTLAYVASERKIV